MKQLILGLILIFSITVSVAQPQIVFDNKNHDFGTFEEETGPVTHDFRFVNSGNEPLVLQTCVPHVAVPFPNTPGNPLPPETPGALK